MGRTARSKLDEARQLDKDADALKKRDPEAASLMDGLARTKRRSAIRQMKRRPKRKGSGSRVVL